MAYKPKYYSVSQFKQYEKCAYSYKLARIDKVWTRPAAWLPQGSAVHTVAEILVRRRLDGHPMTLQEAQDLFRLEYTKEVAQYTAETPNFEYWFASGPYRGREDVERRWDIGMEQVEKLYRYLNENPHEAIWRTPDGTLGVELGFDIDLDGIRVRGFIDAVYQVQLSPLDRPEVRVRDYKTGNTPGDDFQLAVYALALAEQYGIVMPAKGDYWMAGKKGKKAGPTYPYDLTDWPRARIVEAFHELEANVIAERFEPDPDPDKCNFCDVNSSCEFVAS